MSLQITVHRGTQQIGGSCIEIAHLQGDRIVLDAGRPLDAPDGAAGLLPASSTARAPQPSSSATRTRIIGDSGQNIDRTVTIGPQNAPAELWQLTYIPPRQGRGCHARASPISKSW